MTEKVHILGRLSIRGQIRLLSGLHIGGGSAAMTIGGVDNTVVRSSENNQPYIPGSSLKGKLRSLLEKAANRPQNRRIEGDLIRIHQCETPEAYGTCAVCNLFGIASDPQRGYPALPTRLVFRDAGLTEDSARVLKENPRTDMPYTEVKTEVAIDRLTAQANPRRNERVPSGAVFAFQILFTFYRPEDMGFLADLLLGMDLLEDDALGAHGSRGYGQIVFEKLHREWVYPPGASLPALPSGFLGADEKGIDDLSVLLAGAATT